MNWSFCIPTVGENEEQLFKVINSIRKQSIENYEIIFATENSAFNLDGFDDCSVIRIPDSPRNWTTKKKNEMAKVAKYPNLCFLHDYFVLEPGWYEGFKEFGINWDICLNRVTDLRGVRFTDWTTLDHPKYGKNYLCTVPYGFQSNDIKEHIHINGAYFCVKKHFILENLLDESKCAYECEDVEWTLRVRGLAKVEFNPYSSVKGLKIKPTAELIHYEVVHKEDI